MSRVYFQEYTLTETEHNWSAITYTYTDYVRNRRELSRRSAAFYRHNLLKTFKTTFIKLLMLPI